MVERTLAEVEAAARGEDAEGKELRGMSFPGMVACSYCWTDAAHPDADGRTMRELWLPAIEWYLSERVHRGGKVKDPFGGATWGFEGAEAELLARSDFAIFVDYASMCQKDADGQRTDVELALFKRALDSLDVVYAHAGVVSFLTTELPEGCAFDAAAAEAAEGAFDAAVARGEAAADAWEHPLRQAVFAANRFRPYDLRGVRGGRPLCPLTPRAAGDARGGVLRGGRARGRRALTRVRARRRVAD
eukprot:1240196-Prymnesium_polylepis.1